MRESTALADRVPQFWARVDRSAGPGGCWLWQLPLDRDGYADFCAGRPKMRAHRFAYELLVGPIPDGLVIDHLCRVRHCVNPAHMEPVTRWENTLRGGSFSAVAARQTHCVNGHPFDEENTHVDRRGFRRCRACNRQRLRRRAMESRA